MSNASIIYRFLGGLFIVASLAACAAPTQTPTPVNIPVTGETPTATTQPTATAAPTSTPEPTINITPTLNAARTESVATAFAGLTQTAQAVPTRTLAPLWTATPSLSTAECQIVSVSPDVNGPIKPNGSFDGKWEVKNTSGSTWSSNEVDIRYVSGTKFQTKHDVIDLPGDVSSDNNTTIIVDMQAPATRGTYSTTWAIYRGSQVVCGLGLTIRVQP